MVNMNQRRSPDKQTLANAVRTAYSNGDDDESMEPKVLLGPSGDPIGRFENGDYVIFYNIRGEREIELSQCLTDPLFDKFSIKKDIRLNLVTMIQYDEHLNAKVAFPQNNTVQNTLCEVISNNGLKQVKLVESEKAVHLNFFFNGKIKNPLPREERIIIESPKVTSYDQVPELSISELTNAIIEKINDATFNFIIANYKNVDVVGHIENEIAIKHAINIVDTQTGIVVEAAKQAGITTLITADHGTVEKWLYPDGAIDTGHTDSRVPFILVDPDIDSKSMNQVKLRQDGSLRDIAPTILTLFGMLTPTEMTGQNLCDSYPPKWLPKKRILLLILDGWGYRDQLKGNLIRQAHTPFIDHIQSTYPNTYLQAAGEAVGMPKNTVGNSEAGHLHIGTGRTFVSDRVKIDQAIQDRTFFENEAILWAMRGCIKDHTRLHLLGIVSFYSSHGPVDYPIALIRLAKRMSVPEVYLHGMLGRRGEQPESGANYVQFIEREMERLELGQVVSIIGRYWALDRENNWDRIKKTYDMLISQ